MLSKLVIRALSFSAIVPLLCIQSNEALSQPNKVASTTALTQKSQTLGELSVTVSKFGVKLVDRRKSVTLISRPPVWEVEIYNTATKKTLTLPVSKYSGYLATSVALLTGRALSDIPLDKLETSSGVAHYRSTAAYSKNALAEMRRQTHLGGMPNIVDFWVDRKLQTSPKAVEMLTRTYGFPVLDAVPIKAVYVENCGEVDNCLTTENDRAVSVSENEYKLPGNYVRVRTAHEVFSAQDEDGDVNEMLQDMGKKVF